MSNATTHDFARQQYSQGARRVSDIGEPVGHMPLDPAMPTDRVRFLGPVYGEADDAYGCVPLDAEVGDRVIGADIFDSATRLRLYEIVSLDDEIGDEAAPWEPRAKVRRAAMRLVYHARSHYDRL